MHRAITIGLALSLAGPLVGQAATSPAGFEKQEANDQSSMPWSHGSLRLQQIDRTFAKNGPLQISVLRFRRDGNPFVEQRSPARSVVVSLLLAHGDLAQAGTTFAKNHGAGAARMLSNQKFELPAWSGRTRLFPSRFDVVLPLPKPWPFDGRSDLLWDLVVHANSSAAEAASDMNNATFSSGVFQGRGPGCHGGTNLQMQTYSAFDNHGAKSKFVWLMGVFDGPGKRQAGIVIDFEPPQPPPPPLPQPPCLPFEKSGMLYGTLLAVPLGPTDGSGMARAQFALPHDPSVFGAAFRMQGFAVDPSMIYGIRLASYGNVVVPKDAGRVDTRMFSAPNAGSAVASKVQDGGLVVGFD